MRRAWLVGLLPGLVLVVGVLIVGCGATSEPLPAAVQAIVDTSQRSKWMTTGDDPWDVFVCHVPSDSQSPFYAGLPLRAPLTPTRIAALLDDKVGAYFTTLSHGLYHPSFRAGGEVTIGATDEPQACVDKALSAATDSARGVIAIADAEHNADEPGGFANPGTGCAAPPCSASVTRRSAYVGAADFSSDWGDRPPMDLIEHEIGHALGWPHSGANGSRVDGTSSALDVMGNSAAPRSVDGSRRDAPATLAVNLLAAGWLPRSAVAVVPHSGATVMLAPSAGTVGKRVAVVGLDDHSFLTVELLTDDGFDDHLPATGVAVHLIDASGATRTQTPLIGIEPFDDLLTNAETFSGMGWRISVAATKPDEWTVTAQPLDDAPTVSSQ
ncbi:MAG TPA: hypothetical protein VGC84_14910 [Ilumatobacteraceae bacterium]